MNKLEMMKLYFIPLSERLYEIIKKVYIEQDQEEIEFNGRWCDDGGHSTD